MRELYRRFVWATVLAGVTLLGASTSARADFVLKVYDDGVQFGLPISTVGNLINQTLTTPHFTFTIAASSNRPGTPVAGNITNVTLDAVNTTGATHTLTFALSDVDFSLPAGDVAYLRSSTSVIWAGGSTGVTTATDALNFTSYVNTNNVLFDTDAVPPINVTEAQIGNAAAGSVVAPTLFLASPGVFSSANAFTPLPGVLFNKGATYSLTNKMVITLGGGNSISANGSSIVTAVPEPASVALLLAGVPAFAAYRLTRRKARA